MPVPKIGTAPTLIPNDNPLATANPTHTDPGQQLLRASLCAKMMAIKLLPALLYGFPQVVWHDAKIRLFMDNPLGSGEAGSHNFSYQDALPSLSGG
jgi:hypothetical protein